MSQNQLTPATYYPAVVGTVLSGLRKGVGLNQTELAQRVGVSQSGWSKIERGATPINIEQLVNAADELGVSPSEILSQADRLAGCARERGVRVDNQRLTKKEMLAAGVFVFSVAALGTLIGVAISSNDDS